MVTERADNGHWVSRVGAPSMRAAFGESGCGCYFGLVLASPGRWWMLAQPAVQSRLEA